MLRLKVLVKHVLQILKVSDDRRKRGWYPMEIPISKSFFLCDRSKKGWLSLLLSFINHSSRKWHRKTNDENPLYRGNRLRFFFYITMTVSSSLCSLYDSYSFQLQCWRMNKRLRVWNSWSLCFYKGRNFPFFFRSLFSFLLIYKKIILSLQSNSLIICCFI